MKRLFVGLLLVCFSVSHAVWAAWPEGVPQPLAAAEAKHYTTLFKAARKGQWDSATAAKLKDKVLLGHAQAELYLSPAYKTTYTELTSWLEKYADYPEASAIYRLAEQKRPKPREVCKGKGKQRKCHTEGTWAKAPPVPWSVERRQRAAAAAEAAREREYDGLSPEQAAARRKVLGESWKLRQAKKWEDAYRLLDNRSNRRLMQDHRWQSELVGIAKAQLVPMNWSLMHKAASLAAQADGADKGQALWLAGFGAYRTGQYKAAAEAWDALVQHEPYHSVHAARGAFWAARAYERIGNRAKARAMLQAAARDTTAYYGLLAGRQLGQNPTMDWKAPHLNMDDIQKVMAIPSARRALALVQVGEVAKGQMALRTANENIPTAYTESLAALALKLHLPAISVQMGKQMYPDTLHPAALFPLAEKWEPEGPIVMDRALLLAITRQESAFYPDIGSHAGAQGLMQLMPATARYIVNKTGRGSANPSALHEPTNNMTLGHDYLAYLQGRTEGDLVRMLAAYNAGLGNVNRWVNRGIAPATDPVMFVESIPFDETRGYVQKVLSNMWIYESRMGRDSWSLASLANQQWPQRWIAIKPTSKDIGG